MKLLPKSKILGAILAGLLVCLLGASAALAVTTIGATNVAIDGANPIILEGATADEFELTIAVGDPVADRTATIPVLAANDTFVFLNQAQVLTNKTITGTFTGNLDGIVGGVTPAAGTFTDLTVNTTLTLFNDAILPAMIGQGLAGQILMSDATPDTAWTTMGGDATIASNGILTIANNAVGSAEIINDSIVNADINAGAAIALSKLSLTWSLVAGANAACNTTCGAATCVAGQDTGAVPYTLVACTDAAADVCICVQ